MANRKDMSQSFNRLLQTFAPGETLRIYVPCICGAIMQVPDMRSKPLCDTCGQKRANEVFGKEKS